MRWGYFAYFAVIGLLVFTIIKGSIGMGAQRWVDLGFFKIQPSELGKLIISCICNLLFLHGKGYTFFFFYAIFTGIMQYCVISFILILKQPDLGTALVFLFSGLIIIWLAGINKRFFIYGGIFLLITAPLSWHMLKAISKTTSLGFFWPRR